MIPRRVVLENFLSFGSPGADITFDDAEPLWVVSGPNGTGKSAVFDAITYALFGCHRGGKQGFDQLVRHGSPGFRIEFEFGFAGTDYRVVRNRVKKAVEKVYRRANNEWIELAIGDGANKVAAWAERELGLTFEQFTASVLLRQGEADKIISAGGAQRLDLLKKVIGVDRYEALSVRVHDGTRQAVARRKAMADQLVAVPVVTDAERAAAGGHAERTADALTAARTDAAEAAGRLDQAGRYAALNRDREEVARKLADADARRAAAADILARNERLRLLTAAVPKLTDLVAARRSISELGPERDRVRATVGDVQARRDRAAVDQDAARTAADAHRRAAEGALTGAKDVRHELTAATAALAVVEEVEQVDAALAGFPTDLDDRSVSAMAGLAAARDVVTAAAQAEAAAAALLGHAERDLAAFSDVEAGGTCSRCRQPIGAEHAARERADLAAEVDRRRTAADVTSSEAESARARLEAATAASKSMTDQTSRRDKLTAHRLGLICHGVPPAVAVARQSIADLEAAFARLQTSAADDQAKHRTSSAAIDRLSAELRAADAELTELRTSLDDTSSRYDRAEATAAALADAIPGDWPSNLTDADVAGLSAEQAELAASGVAEDARKLTEDHVRRDEWEQSHARISADITAIPEAARVPLATAESALAAARAAAADAEESRDAARRTHETLTRHAADRARLLTADRAAEAEARVHARLDDLLGKDGLRRDLVRTAERQIVAFADETVRYLSDNDLSIELEDADEGKDKAFTLRVRRADAPDAIGVAYLSGSQKFRVAVAVALGIGRYAAASAGTRPLESVIIDEGFGSLDRDGLRCMAEELTRLKDRSALKRIVLVSHQEEFVGRFPVGWRLTPTETGTVAAPYSNR